MCNFASCSVPQCLSRVQPGYYKWGPLVIRAIFMIHIYIYIRIYVLYIYVIYICYIYMQYIYMSHIIYICTCMLNIQLAIATDIAH
jgi:hypothetical protein